MTRGTANCRLTYWNAPMLTDLMKEILTGDETWDCDMTLRLCHSDPNGKQQIIQLRKAQQSQTNVMVMLTVFFPLWTTTLGDWQMANPSRQCSGTHISLHPCFYAQAHLVRLSTPTSQTRLPKTFDLFPRLRMSLKWKRFKGIDWRPMWWGVFW